LSVRLRVICICLFQILFTLNQDPFPSPYPFPFPTPLKIPLRVDSEKLSALRKISKSLRSLGFAGERNFEENTPATKSTETGRNRYLKRCRINGGGGEVRVVSKGSAVWKTVGVGSGDVASLLNCSASADETVLDLWASVVRRRDKKELPRVKKVTLDQGSQEWLRWRNLGLGGSEVGCVLGANPYRDSKADRIWERKVGDRPEISDNPAMARGRKLEPEARSLYESLYGWTAEPVCVIHDDHDHLRCSLDGLRQDDKVVLEIKCSGEKNHRKYLAVSRIDDPLERQRAFWYEVPYYRAQVLYQLLITGADVAHFVGFNPDFSGGDRLAVFELYPEPQEMQRLLERTNQFWNFVLERTPPPPEWLIRCDRCPEVDDLRVPAT
jgi:putative phage-type endonuclease